jgi:uncharacterized protein
LSVYLDASVLVALFADDPRTDAATAILRANPRPPIVSDFAAAEFASATARLVRMGDITAEGARAGFALFDVWVAQKAVRVETSAQDIAGAAAFIRRLDLTLRAPDAIHIAIAQRLDADLFTFDAAMAIAARALGTSVISA